MGLGRRSNFLSKSKDLIPGPGHYELQTSLVLKGSESTESLGSAKNILVVDIKSKLPGISLAKQGRNLHYG